MKQVLYVAFTILLFFPILSIAGTLVIYDDTALLQESLVSDAPATHIQISTPMSVIPDSLSFLATGILLEEYTFHPAEKLSEDEILNRSLGKVIHILSNGNYLAGKLLSIEGGHFIIRSGVSVYVLPRSTFYVNLPDISNVDQNAYFDVKLRKPIKLLPYSYQMNGISWQALYTLHVLDESRGLLSAMYSIDNKTDKTFKDVNCILFSGKIYTTKNMGYRPSEKGIGIMKTESISPGLSPKGIGGYYLYPLEGKITLPSNENIYREFMSPRIVKLAKKYTFDFGWDYDTRTFVNADMTYIISNDEKSGLYLPFPKGQFKIYRKMKNTDILLGEVNIDDISRGEEVKLRYGKAYDILAGKWIKEKRKITKNHYMETIGFTVKNNTNAKVTVEIHDKIPLSANIMHVSNNVKYKRASANECVFFIPVKEKGEFSFTYGVDFSY
ncbi:MAG: hypothetical protein J7K51_08330 [Thermotogae bacterium]|nr:hypothetical protein [Thermotogota bacterium]